MKIWDKISQPLISDLSHLHFQPNIIAWKPLCCYFFHSFAFTQCMVSHPWSCRQGLATRSISPRESPFRFWKQIPFQYYTALMRFTNPKTSQRYIFNTTARYPCWRLATIAQVLARGSVNRYTQISIIGGKSFPQFRYLCLTDRSLTIWTLAWKRDWQSPGLKR